MGIEYVIRIDEKRDECYAAVAAKIKERFPAARMGISNSIYLPSDTPGWEDFSLEKTESGLFILSTVMSGQVHEELFRIMKTALNEFDVKYEIEEV